MTTRLFFRPSCTFLDLSLRFWFYCCHYLDPFSVIPTSDRTNGHSGRPLRLYCGVSSTSGWARTHAQDAAQHTWRHVESVGFFWTLSGEGIIALLQAEGLVHLPSVFYSGCQNGEEETEPDTLWETIWGGRVPPRHPRPPNEICSSEGWRVGQGEGVPGVCSSWTEEIWLSVTVESLCDSGSRGLSFIQGGEAEQRLRIESLILWKVHLQILFLLPFMSEMTGYLTADGCGWPENLPLLL